MISKEICERVLQKASSTGADYAEIFAENTLNHSVNLVGGKVDAVHDAQIAGAAVRVFLGLRSVMATTVDTSEAGLMRCAQRAAEALAEGHQPAGAAERGHTPHLRSALQRGQRGEGGAAPDGQRRRQRL